MKSSADTLLIGAVIQRMGNAQAKVLLDQVKTWLRQPCAHRELGRTERRRSETDNRIFDQNTASQTQEDH